MTSDELIIRPEEGIYQSCYAGPPLADQLADPLGRGKIRRVPPVQLFFGMSELSDEQMGALLPHITEEQWRGALDLALWSKDETGSLDFLRWSRYLLDTPPAVARKLIRASDPELWQLAFNRLLHIRPRSDDDEGTDLGEGDWIVTPDGQFWVGLPSDPEASRLIRPLLLKLFELDPEQSVQMLLQATYRTATELQESAYQARRRRIEDLGFQDYFEAISVYSPVSTPKQLSSKKWEHIEGVEISPVRAPLDSEIFFFAILARISEQSQRDALLEELFYVSNKVLSADLVTPSPHTVRIGLRKTIFGINIGLEEVADGEISRGLELVHKSYLQSFFQMAHTRLLELQGEAHLLRRRVSVSRDSYAWHLLQGLIRPYPLLAVRSPTRIKKRFFRTRLDIRRCQDLLEAVRQVPDDPHP